MIGIGRIVEGAREGSLGGLLGRAGRWLRHSLAERLGACRSSDPRGSVAFTIAVIALGAKMAKADGTVTRDEVAAFREIFQVPRDEDAHLRCVFGIARRSTAGYELYARQVGRLFAGRRADLEDLLGGLFYIALADGRLCPAEDAYLREVARHLGFSAAEHARIRAAFAGAAADSAPGGVPGGSDDPHAVLGVAPDASLAEIRAAYRRLIRTHHPDLLSARGMPRERVALATARVARINAARDRLLRNRAGNRFEAQPA